MTLIKFAYVGEFTSRRRRVGVGEFARRRVDRIPITPLAAWKSDGSELTNNPTIETKLHLEITFM